MNTEYLRGRAIQKEKDLWTWEFSFLAHKFITHKTFKTEALAVEDLRSCIKATIRVMKEIVPDLIVLGDAKNLP